MRGVLLSFIFLLLVAMAARPAGWNGKTGGPDVREERAVAESGVKVISAPVMLKTVGRLRGSVAPYIKLDIGVIRLEAGACPRFEVTVDSGEAALSLRIADTATGESLEGTVTGSGRVEFENVRGGEYILTLENLSIFNAYFTIDYDFGRISI